MPEPQSPSKAILRTLTFPVEPPDNLILLDNVRACDGTYRCGCAGCEIDRIRRVKQGVRRSEPLPIKRKAA